MHIYKRAVYFLFTHHTSVATPEGVAGLYGAYAGVFVKGLWATFRDLLRLAISVFIASARV